MPVQSEITQKSRRLEQNRIAVSMETRIEGAITDVFDFVAAEDVLPKVLTGYGLLPAVVKTTGTTGPWDKPGSHRIVNLKDGTTAREEVTTYRRPEYFAYKTSEYTFALKYLATGATGEWWFEREGNGTKLRWTYTFQGKNSFTSLLLSLFARTQWAGYMTVCLRNVQKHFAARHSAGASAR